MAGDPRKKGDVAPRAFPAILTSGERRPFEATDSGRRNLADAIASRDNPVTARVIANRIWAGHFGYGLVRTLSNFGQLGERPTHPELLDYLAQSLQRDGWSLKSLHRRILLSATWQMSTHFNEAAASVDPENRLWWRFNRRRLEVEALRDSVFAVAGTIDSQMGGTLLPTPNRQYVTSTANVNPVIYDPPRRSIYLPVVRSALYDVFQAFDFADPSVQSGRRETTTVAPQALFLMNSDLVLKQTRSLARQLLDDASLDDSGRIERLYSRALGRTPRTAETARALAFLETYAQASTASGGTSSGTTAAGSVDAEQNAQAESARERAWQSLCRAVLASNEFIYVE
ncbi:MAG: DUF1553 domain-containing protein [Planctomycetaceae bacterium]|nr:MAG: DUF1553 domain-containing protein [Planctomycetaceae bacterium]